MATRVSKMPAPDNRGKIQISNSDYERIKRRRQGLDVLRKQAEIAMHRLKVDIFNTWRTGNATMAQLSSASGYTEVWIGKIIEEIKDNPELLEEAIRDWIKENPNESLNGRLDDERDYPEPEVS